MDIRLCVPGMKYGSTAFMKVKYFKEGMKEKRHFKYNISLRRNLSQCQFMTLQTLMLP